MGTTLKSKGHFWSQTVSLYPILKVDKNQRKCTIVLLIPDTSQVACCIFQVRAFLQLQKKKFNKADRVYNHSNFVGTTLKSKGHFWSQTDFLIQNKLKVDKNPRKCTIVLYTWYFTAGMLHFSSHHIILFTLKEAEQSSRSK